MHYLVSGSAGFLGTNLIERLLDRGDEVTGIDNYVTGQRANTRRFERRPGFRFVEADVARAPLEELFAGVRFDRILHLASLASPPAYQRRPVATLEVGALGTQRLLDLARRCDARLLLASTSEIYGDPQIHPQTESYWGHVNPVGPRACYDESKRYAEALVTAYRHHYGVDTCTVRIFNTYGPHMRADDGRVITNFIAQALAGRPLTVYGHGRQTRSFLFVDDFVDAVTALLDSDLCDPVNIGNPVERSVLELAETVREMFDPSLEIVHRPMPADDPQRRCPDIALARRELGWKPRIGLEEGLRRTADALRAALANDPATRSVAALGGTRSPSRA